MGSTFVDFESIDNGTWVLDKPPPSKVWLQFVPGIVTRVICNNESIGYKSNEDINSIIAKPHMGDSILPNLQSATTKYYPLFRGISDAPVMGDQVLLCSFGERNYYLGPINTENLPNKNVDNMFIPDINLNDSTEVTMKNIYGQSKNFYESTISRLQKVNNYSFDDPRSIGEKVKSNTNTDMLSDLHGDMVLEGRHGNSLRIGSRGPNPCVIISNGRSNDNICESSLDGSIIGVFQSGSLRKHFFMDGKLSKEEAIVENYEFKLADGEIDDPKRTLEKSFESSLGRGLGIKGENDPDITNTIYNYVDNQILNTSDRITFNARKDSIFISAFQHVHVGSGNSMTFSTSKNILTNAAENIIINTPYFNINSNHITIDAVKRLNLGNPKKNVMNRAVLGNQLSFFLKALIQLNVALCKSVTQAVAQRESEGSVSRIMDSIEEEFNDLDEMYLGDAHFTGSGILSKVVNLEV